MLTFSNHFALCFCSRTSPSIMQINSLINTTISFGFDLLGTAFACRRQKPLENRQHIGKVAINEIESIMQKYNIKQQNFSCSALF